LGREKKSWKNEINTADESLIENTESGDD